MNNRNHILIAIGLLAALAILGTIMRGQIPPRIDLPFDLTSTTLAAEFASNPVDISAVVATDRRYANAVARQQYWDFAFIACYVALFAILGLALRSYDVPAPRLLAWTVVGCAIAGGAFDIAENITILNTMANANSNMSHVRWFSLPKWALAFLVLSLESVVFLFWPGLKLGWRIAAVLVGSLFLFAGAGGLLFTLLESITDIAWAAQWMGYAMASALLFLLAYELAPMLLARTRRLRY